MSNIDFYYSQMNAMRAQALAAELPSVRERCERSAAAWQAMIEREESYQQHKAANQKRAAAG